MTAETARDLLTDAGLIVGATAGREAAIAPGGPPASARSDLTQHDPTYERPHPQLGASPSQLGAHTLDDRLDDLTRRGVATEIRGAHSRCRNLHRGLIDGP